MHTSLVAGRAGEITFYEIAVFDHSDRVLNRIGQQGASVLPSSINDNFSGTDLAKYRQK